MSGVRSGVDANSMMRSCRLGRGRMAVNHHLLEGSAVVEKIISDPKEIFSHLLIQRNARANAGMAKIVIALNVKKLEILQEFYVFWWQFFSLILAGFFEFCLAVKTRGHDTVA